MDDIKKQIDALTAMIEQAGPTADLHYRRGKLYWRLGQRAAAITDFNEAVALDPVSPAAAYSAMTGDIMDFYNTDLYNP